MICYIELMKHSLSEIKNYFRIIFMQLVHHTLILLGKFHIHMYQFMFVFLLFLELLTASFTIKKHAVVVSRLTHDFVFISALYVVDLKKFRRIAAGDRLRGQYQGLSQDPNSLSNLDQDLPNNMIHQVAIKSLPQDWLWCETWCSDESKKTAKTIDLVKKCTLTTVHVHVFEKYKLFFLGFLFTTLHQVHILKRISPLSFTSMIFAVVKNYIPNIDNFWNLSLISYRYMYNPICLQFGSTCISVQ